MPLPSPVDIARLEEQRQAIGTGEVALVAEPVGGGVMSYGGPGSWANQACALGLDGPVTDADLERLVDFYASRGVEPKVVLAPFAHESLVAGLGRRGFVVREFTNVFARDLSATATPWPGRDAWPRGLEVVDVDPRDDAQVRTMVEVSTSGFRPEGVPIDPVLLDVTTRVVRHPRCRSFLALVDGVPAGGAISEVAPGISSLFGTSVLPAFRRRGVQTALMGRRLDEGRARGRLVATIQSHPGIATERNAARMGFVLVYTKVAVAMPRPGLEPSA